LIELTSYGVAPELAPITINLKNIISIYPTMKDKNIVTCLHTVANTYHFVKESYNEVMEAVKYVS